MICTASSYTLDKTDSASGLYNFISSAPPYRGLFRTLIRHFIVRSHKILKTLSSHFPDSPRIWCLPVSSTVDCLPSLKEISLLCITVTSHERHGVSNLRQLYCLVNRKRQSSGLLLRVIHWWPMDSTYNIPVSVFISWRYHDHWYLGENSSTVFDTTVNNRW